MNESEKREMTILKSTYQEELAETALAEKMTDQGEEVECDACGKDFKPADGYYERGEYAYCADCW